MRTPRFFFTNKDDPEYEPNYGNTFTERQLAIINDKIPLADVRVNELTIILKKSNQIGDFDIYDIALNLYNLKTAPCEYTSPYSVEESKKILQDLTPWKIDWGS